MVFRSSSPACLWRAADAFLTHSCAGLQAAVSLAVHKPASTRRNMEVPNAEDTDDHGLSGSDAGNYSVSGTASTTATISGTATSSPGTYNFTVRATDANGCPGTVDSLFKICPVIAVSPANPSTPVVGFAYSQTLTASNGAAPYTWTVASGTLPDGRARFREEPLALDEGKPDSRLSALFASGGYQLRHSPVGFRSQFHCTPAPQWVFILSGQMEIGLQDGSSRLFGAGQHFYSADTLPGGATFDDKRHGHWSRQVGDVPLQTLFVRA